jgi:hypothetical protein
MRRCPRCLSIGLICLCLGQGVKAPPSATISVLVGASATASTATVATSAISVNAINGKAYDVSPSRPQLYGEHDSRPRPEGPVYVYWPPPPFRT